MLYVVFPYTLNPMVPKIDIICCSVSKTLKGDIHRFTYICSWIPLTIVKLLPLVSALLYIRIPSLAFNCLYASSVTNKILNPLTNFAESTCICGFHLHFAESTYSLRNPLSFADSTYILWNPLTFAQSRTTSYISLLRNLRHNKCADKIYVTGICTRNPRKFFK